MPLICVGNLSVGGTGKSPMVELLIRSLKDKYKIATLSRGYKRKTKGYALADEYTTALDIGDEPMQFHVNFPDVPVAVGEERLDAISQLLHDKPDREVIILDDAFQHRAIKAGLNILLTDYNNLFTKDFYLPTGDLRDLKSSYKRAEVLVVTKCKADLSKDERQRIVKEINVKPYQDIFFTSLEYGELYKIFSVEKLKLDQSTEVLLVSGIANPKPLKAMLEEHSSSYHLIQFPDHHIFSIDDLKEIKNRFEKIETNNKIILTTEKDAVRLDNFKKEIGSLPFFVIPVKHHFLFNEGEKFDALIHGYIKNFKK